MKKMNVDMKGREDERRRRKRYFVYYATIWR